MMSKSRLGNKSAYLCAVLIYSANKIDQYLIKLSFFSGLSMRPIPKLSPISADNSWNKNSPILYALAHTNSGPLRLYDLATISYDGFIRNRKFRTIIKIQIRTRTVRYDRSYTKRTHTKKPDILSGFFIAYHFSFAKQA
jgi:hypothetical protein